MKLCMPVDQDRGLDSPICAHFGSAPAFVVVDTESRECRSIPNLNAHHAHGACQPIGSLAGVALDAVAVGGIGRGALEKLRAANLRVLLSTAGTVRETVAAFEAGALKEASLAAACGHHHGPGSRGIGHGHRHRHGRRH